MLHSGQAGQDDCPERGAPTPRDNAVPGNAQSWSSALRSSDIFLSAAQPQPKGPG